MAWGPTQAGDWPTAIDPWLPSILTGPQSGKGRKVIFDIEGDGLLFAQGNVEDGVRFLAECEVTVGHNAIAYDYPALERLYPWFKRCSKAWDSIIIAKAYWPPDALVEQDMKLIQRGKMPGNMLKRHSLEAWGYRTGTHKGDYEGGFDAWCPAMAVYLMGDIRGTLALWKLILRKLGWLVEEGATPTDHLARARHRG